MTAISDYQFELGGVAFGIRSDITVEDGGFDTGSAEWTDQDRDYPGRPGTAFGVDTLRGPTWAWNLSVDKEDDVGALEALGTLASAWRPKGAGTPGFVVALRYGIAGRFRRVYGRPRRWAAPPSNRILGGYIPITCEFKTADPLHYDDTEGSIIMGIASQSDGGFTFPVTFPVDTLPNSQRVGQIQSFGDADTYPIITIDGPATNPWVASDTWRLEFKDFELTAGQSVEIDTRPWAMTVLRDGNASVAHKLARRIRLSRIKIVPGVQEITFGASAASGSAQCTIRWRDAWNSL